MNLACVEKKVENWGEPQRKYGYYYEFQLSIPHAPDDFWPPNSEPSIATTGLLDKAIESSKDMLKLENNWDGEGAVRISGQTWQKAVNFLTRHRFTWDLEQNVPTISPLPNGSIDLHWKSEKFELLVNIQEKSEQAGVYGDDYKTAQIRRHLDLNKTYPAFWDMLTSTF